MLINDIDSSADLEFVVSVRCAVARLAHNVAIDEPFIAACAAVMCVEWSGDRHVEGCSNGMLRAAIYVPPFCPVRTAQDR